MRVRQLLFLLRQLPFCLEPQGVAFHSADLVRFIQLFVYANQCLGGLGIVGVQTQAIDQCLLGFLELTELEQSITEGGVGARVTILKLYGFKC